MRTGLRVGQQDLDASQDLFVEVDEVLTLQKEPVLLQDLFEVADVWPDLVDHRSGIPQAESRRAQRLDPRRERIGVGATGDLHEPAEQPPYLGFVDGLHAGGGLGRPTESVGPVDDRQRERVESADSQARQVGGAFLHLQLGPLVERHEGERSGREVAG